MNFHAGLAVAGGGENFRLAGRNGRIALDQAREHAAEGLNAQRERGDIQQEHVLHFALEHAALDAGADGDDFVRIHTLMRLLVDKGLGHFHHAGHTGHAADEHELINLGGFNAGVRETGLGGLDGAFKQRVRELLHFGAGQGFLDVLRAAGIGRDERQVDVIDLRAGEGDLRLFRLFFNTLEGVGLLAQVNAAVGLEFVEDPVHEGVVPIIATQVGVAVGGFHFEHAVADFEHGNIERTAAEIVHGDLLVFLLVETVGEGRRGGFIDDAQDFETGDAAGILGGLALGIVEIRGHGDDGLRDGFAQARFGIGLELGENHRGNFGGRELLGLAFNVHFDGGVAIRRAHDLVGDALDLFADFIELAAHEPFDGVNGVARVGHGLALRGVADDAFARLGEGHHGRRGTFALGIFQNERFAAFHDRHTGIRGAQINA